MEDARFDTLARKIGVLTTRRTTLAAAVGAALGVPGWAESEAAKSGACKQQCPECQRCKQGKCKKRHGKKHCKQDRRQPQPAGAACSLGSGRGGCCDGRCLDLKTDKANCGTCGNACGATQVCQDGTCFSTNSCLATVTGLCSSGFSVPCGEGAGPGQSCYCSLSAEGNVVCIEFPIGVDCSNLTACATSAGCPEGRACVETESCCTLGPANACFASCPNSTASVKSGKRSRNPLMT